MIIVPSNKIDNNQMLVEIEQNQFRDTGTSIHYCGVEVIQEVIHGTLLIPILHSHNKVAGSKNQIPLLGQGHTFRRLSFYIYRGQLIFVDYDDIVTEILKRKDLPEKNTVVEELYNVLTGVIEKDSTKLDEIYKQLASLEEEIPKDNSRFFLQRMATMKQTIYQMFRYYNQMTEMFEELQDCEKEGRERKQYEIFERLEKRTQRLSEDTQVLREYAMEIWEIYQSQINIRQNDIMKVLTIVTTIFLPLTLIAGWYGMNFEHMPEIPWKYGYVMAIAMAAFIVVFSLVIFKKKKYW